MKRCKHLSVLILGFLLLALIIPTGNAVSAEAATESMGECVVELSSRRFLSERGADKKLPMASTTKIMTALVILDEDNLDEIVTVPKEAEGTEGSSVYLKAGEVISVRELLYGLMLRSGNDCAVTLALHHSGSIRNFAQAMNEKAIFLGAEDSNFTNPHGLPDENHYTTARDLALITAAALENGTFREIVSTKFYEPRSWKNKNKMLWEFDGAIGVKTGFTVRAGRCLVSAAERDNMTLICVVLNSPQMFERSEELFENAFGEYQMTKLCSASELYDGCRINYDFSYPLCRGEEDKVVIQTERADGSDEIVGTMKIYLENRLLFSQNLFMMKE